VKATIWGNHLLDSTISLTPVSLDIKSVGLVCLAVVRAATVRFLSYVDRDMKLEHPCGVPG